MRQQYLFRPLVVAGLVCVIMLFVITRWEPPTLVSLMLAFATGSLLFVYGHIKGTRLTWKVTEFFRQAKKKEE